MVNGSLLWTIVVVVNDFMAVVHITASHVELHVEHIFKLKAIFEHTLRSTVDREHSIYRITKKSNFKNIMPVSFANSALRDCTV